MERAMKTELTGPMDDEMIAEVGYASKRFRGRQVRITIEEVIEEPQTGKRKVKPPYPPVKKCSHERGGSRNERRHVNA
jgi:hypothetical protein